MVSLQGQLLLAAPSMLDPNFERVVVLMVEHGEQGALGLVLNRPTEVSLGDAVASVSDAEVSVEARLRQGGPCEGPLMVVHRDADHAQAEVLPGVYFSTEQALVERLMRDPSGGAMYFAGYAGWGPGQVEGEIGAGSWLVTAGSAERVFGVEASAWTALVREVSKKALGARFDPKIIPPDPSVN